MSMNIGPMVILIPMHPNGYDSSGKRIGSASTDSSGTTTNYDARGKVINRESTSGGPTTIYDAGGRNVGRFTTNR